MRSRAVRRPFLCCDSIAFAPPPCRIFSSSFLISVRRSTMRRAFLSNSGDLRFVAVFRTEADTLGPHAIHADSQGSLKRRLSDKLDSIRGSTGLLRTGWSPREGLGASAA